MGFKLIALPVEYKVIESWTPIYEDPNYWTHERLAKEYSKFKNVATIFGKNSYQRQTWIWALPKLRG